MSHSRRDQAAKAIERRILSLIMRDNADGVSVTVDRRYSQVGWPSMDSWSGDVAGFAMRMAIALHGNEDEAADEQKDTNTGSSAPVWAGFTAREEVIGNLIDAGYNELAARELLGRSDRAAREQVLRDMARQIRAISEIKGWSLWAADYMDPDVEFNDTGTPTTGSIVAELRRLDRAAVLREAAEFVGNDDDCGCGGCDSCTANNLAAGLKNKADEAEAAGGMSS